MSSRELAMSWEDLDHERFFSDPSRRSSRTGLVVLTSALVSTATVAVLYFTVGASATTRRVPALVGMQLHEALVLVRRAGFRMVVSGSAPDPLVAKGAVASQSPLAGSSVASGAEVRVVLSDGVTAPRGRPLSALDASTAPSPDAAGSPAGGTEGGRAGAKPRRHARTSAPAKGSVLVPRVIGLRLEHARSRLHRAGLEVGQISYRADEDQMDRRVLTQSPVAGSRVPLASTVELVINSTEGI